MANPQLFLSELKYGGRKEKKCHHAGGLIVSTLPMLSSPNTLGSQELWKLRPQKKRSEEMFDIACRFGDGLLAIEDYTQVFPLPGKIHCLE
ncbi:unnamed protein product [Eruca vesicaria subsp. sativa]|uniref:Uncharacterized protein n=1 Tax=Eruca vesicaria subsp. sativa TaxID=29727 RepID=A0ABC8J181_ERUVS|nr:unnamed protein product [Eruca vesicaria subsp. sativa]